MKYVAVCEADNDVLIDGDSCCTNLQELYQCLLDPLCMEIEIRADFVHRFFTYSSLCDFVNSSKSIFKHINIHVDDTYYDGSAEAVKNLQALTRPEDFIYVMERNPSRVLATIQTLCKSFMKTHEESTVINNKMASLIVQYEELNKKYLHEHEVTESMQEHINDLTTKLHALVSRVNFRYEKTINPDEMFIVDKNNYNHVLYIKEITRVQFTDSLLYYLQEILKTLYSVPVRYLVIEPYYAYGRAELYPNLKPHWKLTYNDVHSKNIFMAGFQPKVATDILKNSNHVNFLFVLDRGGYAFPHMQGNNITVIHTASDIHDIPDDIDKQHVISYSPDTLYIPMIRDYEKLSREERIQKYSTMHVTKKLIDYLEEVI